MEGRPIFGFERFMVGLRRILNFKSLLNGQCFSIKVDFIFRGDFVSDQWFQWVYDLFGIFLVGPPSHSGFLQKYGKNLPVTFPTRISFLGTCGRIGGA
jgi:hypothetical protein